MLDDETRRHTMEEQRAGYEELRREVNAWVSMMQGMTKTGGAKEGLGKVGFVEDWDEEGPEGQR